jgi:hypothetical protein
MPDRTTRSVTSARVSVKQIDQRQALGVRLLSLGNGLDCAEDCCGMSARLVSLRFAAV